MKSEIIEKENGRKFFNPKTAKYPVIVTNGNQIILLLSKEAGVILADKSEPEANCLYILSKIELKSGWEKYWILDDEVTIKFSPKNT